MKGILAFLFLSGFIYSAVAQTPQQLQAADAELNQVYQDLRGKLDQAQKEQLKSAQRDWIKKRDSFVAANPDNPQSALYQATMKRVGELLDILERESKSVKTEEQYPKNRIEPENAGPDHSSQESSQIETDIEVVPQTMHKQNPNSAVGEAPINCLYLAEPDVIVTSFSNLVSSTDISVWERRTGRKLRSLKVDCAVQWMYPCDKDPDAVYVIAPENRFHEARFSKYNVKTGRLISSFSGFSDKLFYQHIGIIQGMTGDTFWDIRQDTGRPPYIVCFAPERGVHPQKMCLAR